MTALTLPPTLTRQLQDSHWRILVTGANGWLGQATLELLINALGANWRNRVLAFGSTPRCWTLRDGTEVGQQALSDLPNIPNQPSLLLHFAYLTREKVTGMSIEAYTATNRALTKLALEGGIAAGVERVFTISSGAVHAAMAMPDSRDPLLSYGRLKLEDETLFAEFAHSATGRRTFIARLFNLSGPYINKLDSYALSSFIRQARRGTIEIHAEHPVVRSYTSAGNLLSVALGQLLANDVETCLLVETAGDDEVEIGDLARIVRDLIAPHIDIVRPNFTAAPADYYVGDGSLYRKLLAAHCILEHSLVHQVTDTADYLHSLEHFPS